MSRHNHSQGSDELLMYADEAAMYRPRQDGREYGGHRGGDYDYVRQLSGSPGGRHRSRDRSSGGYSEEADMVYGNSGYGYVRGDPYEPREHHRREGSKHRESGRGDMYAQRERYHGDRDANGYVHASDYGREYDHRYDEEPRRLGRGPKVHSNSQRHIAEVHDYPGQSYHHPEYDHDHDPYRDNRQRRAQLARSATLPSQISPVPHHRESPVSHRDTAALRESPGARRHSPKPYRESPPRNSPKPHRESPGRSLERQHSQQRFSGNYDDLDSPQGGPYFRPVIHAPTSNTSIAKPQPLYYDDGKGNYRIVEERLREPAPHRQSSRPSSNHAASHQHDEKPHAQHNSLPRERSASDAVVTSSTLLRQKRSRDEASSTANRHTTANARGVSHLDGTDGADADREVEELFNRFWSERNNDNIVTWEQLQQDEVCQRCGKKVYPVERVDVGAVYHKGCFKCRVCGRQLTLTTFQRELDLKADSVKEVFCNQHVPRLVKGNLDTDAMGIRSALDAQKIKNAHKVNLQMTDKGWKYDPTSSPGYQYAHNVEVKYTLKRRLTLKSFSDFERHGVFEAQTALEQLHRQEEDELYRQMATDRDGHLQRLTELVEEERTSTVRQLIDWFTSRGMSQAERNGALKKLDDFFDRHHESQRELLLSRLATEEQAAVARMVEKHSREMLALIRKKDKEVPSISEEPEADIQPPPEKNQQEDDNTAACPERAPPVDNKDDIYTTPEVFKEQDNQAIEESKKEHKTFTDLVRRLSKRCENEIQKVRSIFRWITVKNLDQIEFADDLEQDCPMAILRGIKHGTESYHDLFKRLCSYAGLHCEIIEGYSKGAGFRPGSRMTSAYRNQWTAVWVEGAWRFINCKWGARHVTGTRSSAYTYKCDEFYFLTDPEQHIYQHFPDETEWQLLKRPIRQQDFVTMPVVKSPFFNNRLSFCAKYDAVLNTRDGFAEIRLYSKRLLPFAAKLKAKHHEISSKVLEDRTMIRTIGKEVVIITNLPCPGSFFLDIFVASGWTKDSMDNACAFQIHCTDVSQDAQLSFPQVGMFGPTPFFTRFGMSEDKNNDPFITCHGEALITISLTKNVKLAHALKRWDPRDRTMADFDRFAFMRHRNDTRATFVVRCPRRGQYVLSLYGNLAESSNTDDEMPCINRYYIECKAPVLDACALPKATRRWKYCRLLEPMQGDLTINTDVHFKVESKHALDIAVSIEGKWHGLELSETTWHGTIFTGPSPGKAMVYGRFDPAKEKYIPLLEYRLVETRRFDYGNVTISSDH